MERDDLPETTQPAQAEPGEAETRRSSPRSKGRGPKGKRRSAVRPLVEAPSAFPSAPPDEFWDVYQRRVFETLYAAVQYAYGMQVPGDVVEFGTMSGETATVLARAIAACDRIFAPRFGPVHGAPKSMWLLDSFAGLPQPAAEPDRNAPHVLAGVWGPASCSGISAAELAARVGRFLPAERVQIRDGWFADTVPTIPDTVRFACMHVDCDLYASTIDTLDPLFARGQVSEGAVILFDDWNCNRASPLHGERRAWDELVARYAIRFSDDGPYGIASRRFTIHGYNAETARLRSRLEAAEQRLSAQAAELNRLRRTVGMAHARAAGLAEADACRVADWVADSSVPPVDQNPISLVSEFPAPFGFLGFGWGALWRDEAAACRMLDGDKPAVVLHATTERWGFVIELSGRSFGASDPATLQIAINDRAPDRRTDTATGENFAITLHIEQHQIAEAGGRLIIGIRDPEGGAANRFGFTGYSIRPWLPVPAGNPTPSGDSPTGDNEP